MTVSSAPITPDQLIAALRKWHVNYEEYPGWRTRGRPGGITAAHGVMQHHTGGGSASASYLYFLFVEGRPEEGIPGPLCNVATAPDGTLHVGAIGRSNHAGSGSLATLNHVVAEDYNGYVTELHPGPDGINGNQYYYGNEIIYKGDIPPTDAAYQTAVLYAAAVLDHYGWTALSTIAHREHTTRKNDPGKVPLTRFRIDVRTVLRIGPTVVWDGKTPMSPIPVEDPVTPEEIQAIATAVWNRQTTSSTSGDAVTFGNLLRYAEAEARYAHAVANSAVESLSEGGATETALDQILTKVSASHPQLTAAEIDAIATAVAAQIPPGTVDEAVVISGVRAAFSHGLAVVPEA